MKAISAACLALAVPALAAHTLAGAAAAEERLTAVHAFPEFLVYTRSFLGFVEEVNRRGAGTVRIDVRGGPEAIGMFEQAGAVRDGVVDMASIPASFYGAAVPESDAMVASTLTPMAVRGNGGHALMDSIHRRRLNAVLLAWPDGGIGFHIYTAARPRLGADGMVDLSGLVVRDNPIYHAFFVALGATTASLKSTEVYSALEKGVVDAAAFTSIGIRDQKWDKFLKYRIDPRFYRTDLAVVVNLDRWRALGDEARALLGAVAVEWEARVVRRARRRPRGGGRGADRGRHGDRRHGGRGARDVPADGGGGGVGAHGAAHRAPGRGRRRGRPAARALRARTGAGAVTAARLDAAAAARRARRPPRRVRGAERTPARRAQGPGRGSRHPLRPAAGRRTGGVGRPVAVPVLPDTHAFLWRIADSGRLSGTARAAQALAQ